MWWSFAGPTSLSCVCRSFPALWSSLVFEVVAGLDLLGVARYSTPLRQAQLSCFAKSTDFLVGEGHFEAHHKTCKCDADDAEPCRDTFHQQGRWTEAELFQRSQYMLCHGEGLHARSWFQMESGWDGVFGNTSVGEFMLTFLLLFSVLHTAANPDFDFSSLACFAIGLAVFLCPSSSFRLLVLHLSDQFLRSSCRAVDLWTQEGHLSAHVRFMVWTIGRCSQVVRSLRGSVHRALFVSAWSSHRTAGHTVNASSTTTPTTTHTTTTTQ